MHRLLACAGAVVLALAVTPAEAGSQSSNSSSNCSNGHCTRMDSYVTENGRWRRGWTRFDAWREGPRWHHQRHWRGGDDDD